jgi:hypothetical protein
MRMTMDGLENIEMMDTVEGQMYSDILKLKEL